MTKLEPIRPMGSNAMPDKEADFSSLTWADLSEWAGDAIVSRGKSYKNKSSDLRTTPEPGLLAWMNGSQRYATRVWFDSDKKLHGECSCPYEGNPCKHAVGLVLAYLEALKKGQSIQDAAQDDPRYDEWDDFMDDEDDDFDNEDGEEYADDDFRGISRADVADLDAARLEALLAPKTREELMGIIVGLARKYPNIPDELAEAHEVAGGDIRKILKAVLKDIRLTTREPAWRNHWSGDGETPDYSSIQEKFELLLQHEHYDELVKLGEELWRLGVPQVENSDDEGETADAINQCMQVVMQAVVKSSLPVLERILWLVDLDLGDDYGILDSAGDFDFEERFSPEEWSLAADVLLDRLKKNARPEKERGPVFVGLRTPAGVGLGNHRLGTGQP